MATDQGRERDHSIVTVCVETSHRLLLENLWLHARLPPRTGWTLDAC